MCIRYDNRITSIGCAYTFLDRVKWVILGSILVRVAHTRIARSWIICRVIIDIYWTAKLIGTHIYNTIENAWIIIQIGRGQWGICAICPGVDTRRPQLQMIIAIGGIDT